MSAPNSVTKNRLLLALPRREFDRLRPHLEQVKCKSKEVLVDADGSLDRVYFPDSGVISVVAVYANGNTIEMATVGREGATGFKSSSADARLPRGFLSKSQVQRSACVDPPSSVR